MEYGGSASLLATFSSNSFTGVPIGTASSNRYIVVGIGYRFNSTADNSAPTVTVNGQSCSVVESSYSNTTTSAAVRTGCILYITDAPVTTGTSTTIVVNGGTRQFTRVFLSAYAITPSSGGVPVGTSQKTPSDTTSFATNSHAVTLSNGMVGTVMCHVSTASTVTGLSVSGPVTENYNVRPNSSSGFLSATINSSGTVVTTAMGTSANARTITTVWS